MLDCFMLKNEQRGALFNKYLEISEYPGTQVGT